MYRCISLSLYIYIYIHIYIYICIHTYTHIMPYSEVLLGPEEARGGQAGAEEGLRDRG